jgi:hypothetical protein
MAKTKHFGPLAAAAGALVAVALLVLMMLVVPAGAAHEGTNGRIAYAAWDETYNREFKVDDKKDKVPLMR